MEDPLDLVRAEEAKSVRPGFRQLLERKAVTTSVKHHEELAIRLRRLQQQGQPPNLVWLGLQLNMTLLLQQNQKPLSMSTVLRKFEKCHLWKELKELYASVDGVCGVVFPLPAWQTYMVASVRYSAGGGTYLIHTLPLNATEQCTVTIQPLEQLVRYAECSAPF